MAVFGIMAIPMMLGMIGTIREWRFARPIERSQVQIGITLDKKGLIDEKGGPP
jgi:hypothetical protein